MVSRGQCILVMLLAMVAGVWVAPAAHADDSSHATFVAHFGGNVPEAARAAVNGAMDIWAQRIASTVPIDVDVDWGNGLPSGVAAATDPISFGQAHGAGPLLPAALLNAVTGVDNQPGLSDIHLRLGAGINWYTGLDGGCPKNATDMVTLVLHELAHGLGFIASFRPSNTGEIGWGRSIDGQATPEAFDTGLRDVATGASLVDQSAFANPSMDLRAEATSGRVVWGLGARDSRGHMPVMYAPPSYEPAGSLMHFDDNAYPAGDPDALMTSMIHRGESIRQIGPATAGVLADIGWNVSAAPRVAVPVPVPTTAVVIAPTTTSVQPPTTLPTTTTTQEQPIELGSVGAARNEPIVTTNASGDQTRSVPIAAGVVLVVLFGLALVKSRR